MEHIMKIVVVHPPKFLSPFLAKLLKNKGEEKTRN